MSRYKLFFFVLVVHLLFFFLLGTSSQKNKKIKEKKLIVKMIASTPRKNSPSLQITAPIQKKQMPSQQTQQKPKSVPPLPQKQQKKSSPSLSPLSKKNAAIQTEKVKKNQKEKPSPALSSSKPSHAIPEHLLHELEQSLAKLEEKPHPPSNLSKKSASPTIPLLKIEQTDFQSNAQKEYDAFLIQQMQTSLQLPEFGEVKMQLTLDKRGNVLKVVVIKAENDKNKRYLQEVLPKLHFPGFFSYFPDMEQKTFAITFCNQF